MAGVLLDPAGVALTINGAAAPVARPRVIAGLIEQHADGAAEIWLRRDQAVQSVDYVLRDLCELDDRLDAHLQGLRCAGDVGVQACERLLADAGPGDLFAPTVLALEARDTGLIEQLLAIAEGAPELARSALSAFGWVSPRSLQGIVASRLSGPSAFVRQVVLTSCAQHRVSPVRALAAACADTDPAVRARAYRTAGEVGAEALRSELLSALAHATPDEVFEAAWALVALGEREHGLDHLAAQCLEAGPRQWRALQTVLAVLAIKPARALLRRLAATTHDPRLLLMAVGLSGDPYYAPWLITQMEQPEAAPLAGEAFAMITGADLVREQLVRVAADDAATPVQAAEPALPLFVGERYLPRPDPQKVVAWWGARPHLRASQDTLLQGLPLGPGACVAVLRQGAQQRRLAAALRLRTFVSHGPLFDCRAPAWRQVRALHAFA